MRLVHIHVLYTYNCLMGQNYSHTCVHVQGTEEQEPGESVDYKGYPGWDKIDALAHALLSLKGLSIKASQVESI